MKPRQNFNLKEGNVSGHSLEENQVNFHFQNYFLCKLYPMDLTLSCVSTYMPLFNHVIFTGACLPSNITTTFLEWWREKVLLQKKGGRELIETSTHAACWEGGVGNRTQDLSCASQESVAAHHDHYFEKLAFCGYRKTRMIAQSFMEIFSLRFHKFLCG